MYVPFYPVPEAYMSEFTDGYKIAAISEISDLFTGGLL